MGSCLKITKKKKEMLTDMGIILLESSYSGKSTKGTRCFVSLFHRVESVIAARGDTGGIFGAL